MLIVQVENMDNKKVLLIQTAILTTMLLDPSFAAFAKESALHVDYNFRDWGDLDVVILKDRMRIHDKLRSWTIILNKPDWRITCFSVKRKTIATMPFTEFRMALGERLGMMTAGDVDPTHWKKVGPALVNGIKTIRYDQAIAPGDTRKPTAQMYVAAETPVNPKVAQFLSRFFDIPNFQALPVRCTKHKVERLKLDTRTIRPCSFKESDFEIPKGYTKKRFEEVLFSQTSFDY